MMMLEDAVADAQGEEPASCNVLWTYLALTAATGGIDTCIIQTMILKKFDDRVRLAGNRAAYSSDACCKDNRVCHACCCGTCMAAQIYREAKNVSKEKSNPKLKPKVVVKAPPEPENSMDN